MKTMEIICTICSSTDVSVFIEISQVPVHCNLLWLTRAEAIQAPRGDIRLGFCKACGHIFNLSFDPNCMEYNQEYENSLHFSPRFQKYAKSLATQLVDRYSLYDKDIIEIGCGRGDFLVMLCKLGGNRGIGFDPSYVQEGSRNMTKEEITFIRDFYSKHYAKYKADIICCRHVLEHIQSPYDFLTKLRHAIGKRFSTVVFFEVPNVGFTLRDQGIWDIIYEHCSYFSISSLARLFNSCSFNICNLSEAMEGQFLCIEALPSEGSVNSGGDYYGGLEGMAQNVAAFANRYRSKVETWQRELKKNKHLTKKAIVWGGGSKGVTFLNTLNVRDQIEYVVDINPYKHGKYVAGTGQEIVPPDFLREYRPNVIIVMNPVYVDEIQHTINNIGITPQVIAV